MGYEEPMLRPLLACLLLSFVVACSNTAEEDARVCAGVTCTAGDCISDNGRPKCVCGAYEQAEGLNCVIGTPGTGQPSTPSQSTPPPVTPPSSAPPPASQVQPAPANGSGWAFGRSNLFEFQAEAGEGYRLEVFTPAGAITSASFLYPSGSTVSPNDVWSVRKSDHISYAFRAPFAETYSFQIQLGSTKSLGPVPFRFDRLGADEVSPILLTVGTSASGNINWEGDSDSARFTPVANHFYSLRCTDAEHGDCFGQLDGSSSAPPKPMVFAPGHVLRANASETIGFSIVGAPGPYSVEVDDLGPDDFGDPDGTPTPLSGTRGQLSGAFEVPGDQDAFVVNLIQGASLDARCTPVGAATSQAGCSIQFFGPGGLVQGDSTGHLSLPVATASGTGVITVSAAGAVTHYSLTWNAAADDAGNDLGSARPVDGLVIHGTIDFAGDRDFWSVPVQPLTAYSVTADTAVQVTEWGFFFPTASFIEPGGSDLQIEVTGNPGPYTITLQPVATDDYLPSEGSGPLLAPGDVVTGHIDWAEDTDVFSFNVSAGSSYSVSVTADVPVQLEAFDDPTPGNAGDIYSDGQFNTSTTVTFTAKATGTDYFGVLGETPGNYSVTVTAN